MTSAPESAYVTFDLSGRRYATGLPAVREIVRLRGLQPLPAMRPPLTGVLDLRGIPLPVLDVRSEGERAAGGDVLVLDPAGGDELVGVAVDRVRAVGPDGLRRVGVPAGGLLPPYVVDVLHDGSGQVLVVDLLAMFRAAAA